MKIGLEFEGVITHNGHIVRWSKIPENIRNGIKEDMGVTMDPVDRYDCLAEVRTEPLVNPSPLVLEQTLFKKILEASAAFEWFGYDIIWNEVEIPQAIHDEICSDISFETAKKEVMTIESGLVSLFTATGNSYRGGGLHINVSPVPRLILESFVLNLHGKMHEFTKRYSLKSVYRNHLLFRHRWDPQNGEWVAEYMSTGFPVDFRGAWNYPIEWAWHTASTALVYTSMSVPHSIAVPWHKSCPNDTNGDGDCGRPLCPFCGMHNPIDLPLWTL